MKAIQNISMVIIFLFNATVAIPLIFVWVSSWFGITLEYNLQLITTFIIVIIIWQTICTIIKSAAKHFGLEKE